MIDGDEFLQTGMVVEKACGVKDKVLERGEVIAREIKLFPALTEHGGHRVYFAHHIHRILGEGVRVLGLEGPFGPHTFSKESATSSTSHKTHKALLIGLRPLKIESREDKMEGLLKEFLACCEVDDPKTRWGELQISAKKLLREK